MERSTCAGVTDRTADFEALREDYVAQQNLNEIKEGIDRKISVPQGTKFVKRKTFADRTLPDVATKTPRIE